MHPAGIEAGPGEAVPAKIFLLRLRELEHFQRSGDDRRADSVKQRLMQYIDDLPRDSIAIKDAARDIEQVHSSEFWTRIGVKPLQFLRTRITPLMRFKEGVNPKEASFALKTEQLSVAILDKNQAEIDRLKNDIGEVMDFLPLNIREVKQEEDLIKTLQKPSFWKDVSYDDAQAILWELTPLMRYKRTEPRPSITLDIDDVIQEGGYIEFGPVTEPKSMLAKTYMEKVENRIKELAEKHPTIQKIMRDEVLNEKDLEDLEKTLNGPDLYVTEETLQKLYRQHNGTLVQFIRNLLGVYAFPEPEKKIDEAFRTFMIEKNYLSADQVNFLRTIETVFKRKHHVEYSDLFEPPFTNFGPNAPVPLLKKDDIDEVLNICRDLESEVFTRVGP